MAIEKNAVVGNHRNLEKRASHGCPACGRTLDTVGSLPRCPVHGTAPFEHGAHISSRGGQRSSR
jgi:hypothetical protein